MKRKGEEIIRFQNEEKLYMSSVYRLDTYRGLIDLWAMFKTKETAVERIYAYAAAYKVAPEDVKRHSALLDDDCAAELYEFSVVEYEGAEPVRMICIVERVK